MDTMNTSNTMHDEDHHFSSPSDYHSTVDEIHAHQSISSGESETFVEIYNSSSPDMLDETSVVTDNVDPNKARRKCIYFSFLRSLFSDPSPSITRRNYRYYLMFIVSAMVFFIYVFIFSCWRIRRRMTKAGSGMFKALVNVPETLALALFSFIAMWFLGGLVVFHAYLTALNQTSSENFKQRYTRTPNPFDKGVFRNIKEALFKRLGPSRVNFRAVVEPEYGCIARMFVNSN
ncbi:hypothetical protein J5N97_011345 [Dioscorea zingiberensis]|uniref:S-acyltransferase n=1 Tax=Dioscorea zingiberensis TaxID=325984 RepID=A0A9D5D073_9LILI|nr:hypothetical protein J5N97_011345 [Dioscorea zingiberensis]